jgi:outer membrane protein OmpA-like peptidoglycan-associated protein
LFQIREIGVNDNKLKAWFATAAMAGLLALGGCATKGYVNQEVGKVQTEEQADNARLADHDAKLGQLDQTSRDALQRAEAAGKLAEGKFLYAMVLSDDSVKFKIDRSELSPDAQSKLQAFADKLKSDNHNVYVEIQGHTDNTGGKALNYQLGEQRAEAVRLFLNKQGVALNRMSTISYGPDAPVQPNDTRDGRAANRRVVLIVLD